MAASRSRTSRAAATMSAQPTPVPGIDVEHDAVAEIEPVDHGAAHMHFEHARLHQRQQPVEVLDRDHLPALAVDDAAQMLRR